MTISEWVSVTLKVATPWALVVPEMVVTTEPDPALPVRVTTWPETGVPLASSRVTVMVELAVPLLATWVGLATTLEVPADTGPWKVTVGFSVTTRPDWLVSVAV